MRLPDRPALRYLWTVQCFWWSAYLSVFNFGGQFDNWWFWMADCSDTRIGRWFRGRKFNLRMVISHLQTVECRLTMYDVKARNSVKTWQFSRNSIFSHFVKCEINISKGMNKQVSIREQEIVVLFKIVVLAQTGNDWLKKDLRIESDFPYVHRIWGERFTYGQRARLCMVKALMRCCLKLLILFYAHGTPQ